MCAGGRPAADTSAGPIAWTHAGPNALTDAASTGAADPDIGRRRGDPPDLGDRARTDSEHIAHQQWLLGFVSGYNAFIADGASIPPDSAGTIGWVDYYGCPHGPDLPLQNGDMTIAQVGIALVEFTRQRTNYSRLWPPLPPVQYVP